MRREQAELALPGHGHGLDVLTYGDGGRPILVFPSEAGRAGDFENNGMLAAVWDLVSSGRATIYCVDSLDGYTWSDSSASIEERAQRHRLYTSWLVDEVVPYIRDGSDQRELLTLGFSLGAYHAVHFALQRADLVPAAIGFSGNYDLSTWHAWGEQGNACESANPAHYVPQLDGEHLAWLRNRLSVLLVCGRGDWETHPTGSLPSSCAMAALLREKGIRCELDLWGSDVSHDWPWWSRQLAYHLPRFC
jgi:esterase/lipase superfamily enzyme